MERYCLDCAGAIRGRSDKRFCDDQCRSSYHNTSRAQCDAVIRKVNTILRRNRQILAGLNPGSKRRISRSKIISAGLNLEFFTHQYKSSRGKTYRFCYDQGYVQVDEKAFMLVKRNGIW